MNYKISHRGSRFVIVDNCGKVVDDAQGYGYTTAQKAHKAMWYKFGGGQQKINKEKREAIAFWREHRALEKAISDAYGCNFKELARDEITEEDLIDSVCANKGVPVFPKGYLKYMG